MQRLMDNVLSVSLVDPVRGDPVGTENWVRLQNFNQADVEIDLNVGTSGEQTILTLLQAKTVGGGSAKALSFTRIAKNVTTNVDAAAFTEGDVSSSARLGVTDGNQKWKLNIQGTDLDSANDFEFFRVDLSTSMADTVIAANASLYDARYTGGIEKFPTSS